MERGPCCSSVEPVNRFPRPSMVIVQSPALGRPASGSRDRVRAVVDTSTLEARYRPRVQRDGIALCLSGGGFRAALFHAGGIRRLNELGLLSQVRTVSSVSGGSIAAGLLASVWPRLTADGRVFTNLEELFERPLRAF